MLRKILSFGFFLAILFSSPSALEATALAAQLNAELRPKIWELRWTRQLIVVTSDDWNAVTARLQRFERSNKATGWQALGLAIDVVVGRGGMGWGIGWTPRGGDAAGIFPVSRALQDSHSHPRGGALPRAQDDGLSGWRKFKVASACAIGQPALDVDHRGL
jgi:L,D-peptidoglycan transpeptidase YkuD (ErfK/YbiS/YcfS/YnhG family)